MELGGPRMPFISALFTASFSAECHSITTTHTALRDHCLMGPAPCPVPFLCFLMSSLHQL